MKTHFSKYDLPYVGKVYFATNEQSCDAYSLRIRSNFALEAHTVLALELLKKGNKFIDLGANIGCFTLPLLKFGCNGLAIEALPENVTLLSEALIKNNFNNCHIVSGAAFDRNGYVHIKGTSAYGTICDNESELRIPAFTVDSILKEHDFLDADLVKIDIEGAELKALAGMKHFFTENTSADFIFEANGAHCVANGYMPRDLIKLFESKGYNIYLITNRLLCPRTSVDFQEFGIVDYLATKKNLAEYLKEFSIGEIPTERTIITALKTMNNMTKHGYRRFMAAELFYAPKEVVNDKRITVGIEKLKNDPIPHVRKAAQWPRFR